MIKIGVTGALGRMGNRILHLAHASKDFKVAAAFENERNPMLGKDVGQVLGLGVKMNVKLAPLSAAGFKGCGVVIDFSSPEGTAQCVNFAVKTAANLVIGTTGLGQETEKAIQKASEKIAILKSPNMSIGANVLFQIAAFAARNLTRGYDIEIVEAHHRLKKDAPSGTAKKLAEVIAKEKGWDLGKVARYGREGITGERPDKEIGIHVVRAGDIVGEHTVIFSGPGETIELTHKAQSRDAFARGALAAAFFLSKKKKGLYTITDVLGVTAR